MTENNFEHFINQCAKKTLSQLSGLGLSISSAESCTAGMFCSSLASISGSSSTLAGGSVVYASKSKVKILNVSQATIDEFDVVSEQVALQMAQGAQKLYETNVCVSVTGYTDPLSAQAGKVCFAFITPQTTITHTIHLLPTLTRYKMRSMACLYMHQNLQLLLSKA